MGKVIEVDDENIASLEEIALKNLKELEMKQDERSNQLKNVFNEIREDEKLRFEKEERIREENKRRANEEHQLKMNENQVCASKCNLFPAHHPYSCLKPKFPVHSTLPKFNHGLGLEGFQKQQEHENKLYFGTLSFHPLAVSVRDVTCVNRSDEFCEF